MLLSRIENLAGMTPEQISSAPVRTERPLGAVEDAELNQTIRTYEQDVQRLEADGQTARAAELAHRITNLS